MSKLLKFFSPEELETFVTWQKEHDKTCPYYDDGTKAVSPAGAIGGILTYCFTPNGIGCVFIVKCACGKEVDCTDYESW